MSDLFSKVGIDLGVVVLLLIVLIIVMMIMTVSMSLRLSRLNQKYRSFMKGKDAQSLEKLFHQRFKEIDKLNKQNELTKKNLADLKKIQGMTLNKYGIVKYDAFDDVGGKVFSGAAHEVTGSCHYLEVGSSKFLVDCGSS